MNRPLVAVIAAALIAAVSPSTPALSEARSYEIDRSHASVSFTISHLGFTNILGRFRSFDADIQFDPEDPASPDNRVAFVIDAASIDTNWERRDDHIRSGDFLDAANHPEIRFVSTAIEPLGNDEQGSPMVRLVGDLTVLDTTGPVVFDVVLNQRGEVRGREVIGFDARGEIDRTEFGVAYGAPAIGAVLHVWVSLEISPAQ